jgi:RND family efflux transporter MFP subunit
MLLLLLFAATPGCGPEVSADDVADAAHRPQSAPVQAPEAGATILETGLNTPSEPLASVEGTAILYSDLDAEVAPQMNGVVTVVAVDLGDAVQTGQMLAGLDDRRQVARVSSATAARDLAQAEFTRAQSLLESGFVTRAEYDGARYRLGMVEAALLEAEVELAHTRIAAPFAGVVTRRMTGVGRAVTEGEALFRITTLQPLRALVRLPEVDAHSIRIGSAALLVGDDGAGVPAVVARVSPAVDPGSGTVEVLLAVPRPGLLRPGSAAVAQFPRPPSLRP